MSDKEKTKDIQREIYLFVEEKIIETDEKGIILQKILDKFSSKYSCSGITITRYLDEMVQKKSPFRLKTWHDGKNRYYSVWTISRSMEFAMILSIAIPIGTFLLDLIVLHFLITDKIIAAIVGFWIGIIFHRFAKNSN